MAEREVFRVSPAAAARASDARRRPMTEKRPPALPSPQELGSHSPGRKASPRTTRKLAAPRPRTPTAGEQSSLDVSSKLVKAKRPPTLPSPRKLGARSPGRKRSPRSAGKRIVPRPRTPSAGEPSSSNEEPLMPRHGYPIKSDPLFRHLALFQAAELHGRLRTLGIRSPRELPMMGEKEIGFLGLSASVHGQCAERRLRDAITAADADLMVAHDETIKAASATSSMLPRALIDVASHGDDISIRIDELLLLHDDEVIVKAAAPKRGAVATAALGSEPVFSSEPEPEPEATVDTAADRHAREHANAIQALVAVPMADWSVAQVLAWADCLAGLPLELVAALKTALEDEEIDGDELADLKQKPLQRALKRAGLHADLCEAAQAVLAQRDDLLAQQEAELEATVDTARECANAIQALVAVPMADWSVAQVLAWADCLAGLPLELVAALKTALEDEEIDGDELADLKQKPLQRALKRAGLHADLCEAAQAVLAQRDDLLAQQEAGSQVADRTKAAIANGRHIEIEHVCEPVNQKAKDVGRLFSGNSSDRKPAAPATAVAAARKLFGKEPEKESLLSQNEIDELGNGEKEHAAAAKVQAIFRGNQGRQDADEQKKEVEVEQKTAGTLIAAKRSTLCSQSIVTLGCIVGTVLTSTVLMHVFGAIAGGSLESGDGDIMVLAWVLAVRYGIFYGMMAWVNIKSTAPVMGDAASGTASTVIQVLGGISLTALAMLSCPILTGDGFDLRTIAGTAGEVVWHSLVWHWPYYFILVTQWIQLIWAHKRLGWLEVTMKHGKGVLAAAIYACALEAMVMNFIAYVLDYQPESNAKWCDNGNCKKDQRFPMIHNCLFDRADSQEIVGLTGWVELWCIKYYFFLLAPAVALSVFTGKSWPKRKQDVPAAMLLSQLQTVVLFHGSFLAIKLYAVISSTLLAQVTIEVLLLFVYLWARVLARRAFSGDPSLESRSLFAYLLITDVFAELAFINVPFMSGQFLVLVFVDFVMLLARDADLWDGA